MTITYFIAGALAAAGIITFYNYAKRAYHQNLPTEEEISKQQALDLEKAEQSANLARNGIKEVQLEKKDLTPQEIALFFNGPLPK